MKYIHITILIILFPACMLAQTRVIPADPQESPILLKGATAHLGNGEVIENAQIGFEAGKLTIVAQSDETVDDDGYTVIDLSGKHIYPGFIMPTTNLGLVEVSALRATRDAGEQGTYNPNVRSIIAYNTDSELIPTMRFNGILMAQITPESGVISGSSSIVQLDAWNWEDATYQTDDGIHLNWPSKMYGPRWWLGETEPRKNEDYDPIVQELNTMFEEAATYANLENREETNLKLEAMQGFYDGSKTLYIHTDRAKSIVSSVKMAKSYGVERVVVVGGYEAILVKDLLLKHDIPVIIGNVHSLPGYDHEDTVYPFKQAADLDRAGITYCLGVNIGMTARARNLPFLAGTTVAYGVDYEKAVQSISLSTAKILGVDDRTGSLEVGKDATLFVSEGDALDMRTNKLLHAFIQGREIQLDARQQFLYEKYSHKYGHDID